MFHSSTEGAAHPVVLVETAAGLRAIAASRVVEILPMVAVDRFPGEGGERYVGALRYRGQLAPVFSLGGSCDPLTMVDHLLLVSRAGESNAAPLVALAVEAVRGVVEVPPAALSTLASGAAHPIGASPGKASSSDCCARSGCCDPCSADAARASAAHVAARPLRTGRGAAAA